MTIPIKHGGDSHPFTYTFVLSVHILSLCVIRYFSSLHNNVIFVWVKRLQKMSLKLAIRESYGQGFNQCYLSVFVES